MLASSNTLNYTEKGRQFHPVSFYGKSRLLALPGGSDGKEYAQNAGDLGSTHGSGRYPREGNGYTPVYLCGEFHGQKSLKGYTEKWDHKDSDMTEQLIHTHSYSGYPH